MIDALDTFLRALGLWVVVGAALGTLVVLGAAAVVAWAWRRLTRRPVRPSWARGRLRARILARTRLRAPSARTAPRNRETV
ncbi:hypothetical protein [Streptomyces sp. NPDC052114]|uniref:hypothetical protein n=1 Tax=unclassified Streptomyces TaxID=2593676 RepID=UPI00342C963F